jgi:hypothetical protein
VLVFAALPFWQGLLVSLVLTWSYQYVIAWMYGVKAMPSMDSMVFMGEETATVNFVSITTMETYDFEQAKVKARKFMLEKPKLRWHIVELFGDYYWKDTKDVEEILPLLIQKVPRQFKSEKELEAFVNEEINKPIPLNRPQWQVWF